MLPYRFAPGAISQISFLSALQCIQRQTIPKVKRDYYVQVIQFVKMNIARKTSQIGYRKKRAMDISD